ncbi:MAG: M16 family metallopeptidase [Chitinophagales bacterium]
MIKTKFNRTQAPILHIPNFLTIPRAEKLILSNQIPVHYFRAAHQEVLMLKLVFAAGNWFEPAKLVAGFTNSMIKEGTTSRTSKALMDEIEYYGASIRTQSKRNYAEIQILTLSKYLSNLLPLLKDMLENATFSADELVIKMRNSQQKLAVNLQKNDFMAARKFRQSIYGNDHPYGYASEAADYNNLTVEQLKAFYKTHYTANNCTIYLAGRFDDQHLKDIDSYLGQNDWTSNKKNNAPKHQIPTYKPTVEYISRPQTMQAAIVIGFPLFNHTHEDYPLMFFTNTILGGFFGSRLMRNIREEKGYTYGIYSAITPLLHGGHCYISTEVGVDVWKETIKEIFFEIERLKTVPLDATELTLVQNYLMGVLISQTDGVFHLASAFQGTNSYGLDLDYYEKLADSIKYATAKQVQEMAQKYFDTENMSQFVVGK